MRFLVDECLPERLILALRAKGHDVVWASEICRSQPDEIVLKTATDDGRIVITEDRDFGNLTIRHGLPAVGIVIADIDSFHGGISHAIPILCERVDALGTSLIGKLTVIEEHRIRQRQLSAKN